MTALVGLSLLACASSSSDVETAATTSSDNCRRGSRGTLDYAGQTPEERWERSTLVITGTVEAVADGPYTVDQDGCPERRNTVLQLAVTEIHKGVLPDGANQRVYVAKFTFNLNAGDIAPYLPVGDHAVAFLSVWPDPGTFHAWSDGRPAGQPLLQGSVAVYPAEQEPPRPEAVPTTEHFELPYLVPQEAIPTYPAFPCYGTDESGSATETLCQTWQGTIQPQG
jgi:hypothetical protein